MLAYSILTKKGYGKGNKMFFKIFYGHVNGMTWSDEAKNSLWMGITSYI